MSVQDSVDAFNTDCDEGDIQAAEQKAKELRRLLERESYETQISAEEKSAQEQPQERWR